MFIFSFVFHIVEGAVPGTYVQWREKLPFNTGDPIPECKDKCYERCGPEHKGVSMCASLLEFVDPIVETSTETNSTSSTTEVFLDMFI